MVRVRLRGGSGLFDGLLLKAGGLGPCAGCLFPICEIAVSSRRWMVKRES